MGDHELAVVEGDVVDVAVGDGRRSLAGDGHGDAADRDEEAECAEGRLGGSAFEDPLDHRGGDRRDGDDPGPADVTEGRREASGGEGPSRLGDGSDDAATDSDLSGGDADRPAYRFERPRPVTTRRARHRFGGGDPVLEHGGASGDMEGDTSLRWRSC